jgi:hypothetical protein
MDLRVLSLNIWVGGAGQLGKMIEIIRTCDADVVGVQEAFGKLTEMAESLGFYSCVEASILSRFPIRSVFVDSVVCPKGYGVRIEAPAGDILVFNSHLSAWPYGPHIVRDGGDTNQAETTRIWEITRVVELVASVESLNLPTFLVGDHNTVSHLDRTGKREPCGPFLVCCMVRGSEAAIDLSILHRKHILDLRGVPIQIKHTTRHKIELISFTSRKICNG